VARSLERLAGINKGFLKAQMVRESQPPLVGTSAWILPGAWGRVESGAGPEPVPTRSCFSGMAQYRFGTRACSSIFPGISAVISPAGNEAYLSSHRLGLSERRDSVRKPGPLTRLDLHSVSTVAVGALEYRSLDSDGDLQSWD